MAGVAGGYALRLPAGWVDADRFETLAQAGAQLARNEAADAAGTLRGALSLWRGPAFADVRDEPFAQGSIGRLDELRMAAIADRIDADLALRRHDQLVPELEALVGEHPLRERLRAQLMLALYGSGRQSDALAVYRDTRRMLIEELGVEPSRELRDAHQFVLRQGELPPRWPGPTPPDAVRLRATVRRRLLTCVVAVPRHVNRVRPPGRPGSGPGRPAGPEVADRRDMSRVPRNRARQRRCRLYHRLRLAAVPGERRPQRRGRRPAAGTRPGWRTSRALPPEGTAARCRCGHRGSRDDDGPEAPFLLGELAEQAGALARAASQGQVLVALSHLAAHLTCCARDPPPQPSPVTALLAIALEHIDAGAASIRRRWEGPYIGRKAELGLLGEALNAVRPIALRRSW